MNDTIKEILTIILVSDLEAFNILKEAREKAINLLGKHYTEESEISIDKPSEKEFDSLIWKEETGSKGIYFQTKNNKSQVFRKLQNLLDENKGFYNLYGWKLWFHNNDSNVMDRKK